MSTFSSPERPVSEIITILSNIGIGPLSPSDIAKPTADLVFALYSNILAYIDPLPDDAEDGQISFAALEILDNPDLHADSIRILDLYARIRDLLASIHIASFTLRDLLAPDPRRTVQILSGIVNFLYYRDDKLNMLKPIVDQLTDYEETKMELETKIAELNKEIMDHDAACQTEEPMVRELDAEVKELRQKIQNYNKHQASLKTMAAGLKEKIDAIDEKMSKVDFEILQSGQENADLLSNIVQSPEKLQRALEVKKLNRAEVKDSEKSAERRVQEQSATLEVYSKVFDKMTRLSSKVQDIQDKINAAKAVEKEIKALKAKSAGDEVSSMKLEAKIAEWQGKAKQIEELIKTSEKEKVLRQAEESQKLHTVKVETESKLSCLESRESEVEAMVSKGKSLCSDAELAREAGELKLHEMVAKCEAITRAFHSYCNTISPYLQMVTY